MKAQAVPRNPTQAADRLCILTDPLVIYLPRKVWEASPI